MTPHYDFISQTDIKIYGATTYLIYAIPLMYAPNYIHTAAWNKLHVICLKAIFFKVWNDVLQ
jgi:hypothetical protein